MATKIRMQWNRKAFREIRTMLAVQKDLERRGAAIANASGEGFEVESSVTGGLGRARTAVIAASAEARRRNATENTLLRNLGAGKG